MITYFKTIVGSRLYGLSTPTSDTDFRGFGMPDVPMIIGLNRQEQDESKSLEDNEEGTVFSVSKFLHLLTKGNPTVFEIAFARPKFHMVCTPEGDMICEFVRKNFVTKHLFKPYNAYFRAQRHELNNTKRTGKRLDLVKQFGYDVKFASHAVRLGYQCIQLMDEHTLNPTLEGEQQEICYGIKTGKFSLSYVNDILKDLDGAMYTAYQESTLPAHPDFDSVNRFCMSIYYDYLLKNYKGCSYVH